jgi:hypothetical protein
VTADLTSTKAHFGYVRTDYPQYNGGAVDVGQIAYQVGLKVLDSLSLFEGQHADWIEGNYVQFLKPAIARGNVLGVLIGNEDLDQFATILQYLQRVKQDFPQTPVSTAQHRSGGRADLLTVEQ